MLKALQYFLFIFWGNGNRSDITRISGETYWIYRLYAEGLVFALASASCFAAIFNQMTAEAMTGFLVAGIVLVVVGLLEMLRLSCLLRAQVEFAELFYG
jgi:hypothetical protein